jgi:hypothetical protein
MIPDTRRDVSYDYVSTRNSRNLPSHPPLKMRRCAAFLIVAALRVARQFFPPPLHHPVLLHVVLFSAVAIHFAQSQSCGSAYDILCTGRTTVLTNGSCVAVTPAPCDDGQACTTDMCLGHTGGGVCAHHVDVNDAACVTCNTSSCTPTCSGRQCGLDPKCGQTCGSCSGGAECSADGQCIAALCTVAPTFIATLSASVNFTRTGDLNNASLVDQTVPSCSGANTPDAIYKFVIPEPRIFKYDIWSNPAGAGDTILTILRNGV